MMILHHRPGRKILAVVAWLLAVASPSADVTVPPGTQPDGTKVGGDGVTTTITTSTPGPVMIALLKLTEIAAEGIDTADMLKRQMAKIEELTLNVIEQQRMIDALRAESREAKMMARQAQIQTTALLKPQETSPQQAATNRLSALADKDR